MLPKLSNEDLIAVEREFCKRKLRNFVRRAWPILEPVTPLAWGWALDGVCEYLEAVTKGDIKRLLINVPPGMMKSLLVNVMWPAWEWGPLGLGHLRYLSTAHKEALAVRDNMKCRRLIQSGWFQKHWPTKLVSDQNAKTKFENDQTGLRECMSFTSLTGSRGDRVMVDDPLSVDDGNSEAALLSVETTFLEALPSRLNSKDSAIVVIMQRLHQRDPSGIILSKPDLGYEHVCLPMRFEKKRAHAIDKRKEEGELLFPELYPEERVVQLEASLGTYGTAGQLQQRPTPRGGGIFKAKWFQYYAENALPKIVYRQIYADTAQKTNTQNDYSVFQCWGYGIDGRVYLLDQVRGKWEAPDLLKQAKAFWAKHKAVDSKRFGMLRKIKIEDKSSGTGLIQQLHKEGSFVEAIPRDKDKITRAYDATPFVEQGLMVLPQDAPFLSDLLLELEVFPMGAHDDQVDPLMDAIVDLLNSPQSYAEQLQTW